MTLTFLVKLHKEQSHDEITDHAEFDTGDDGDCTCRKEANVEEFPYGEELSHVVKDSQRFTPFS